MSKKTTKKTPAKKVSVKTVDSVDTTAALLDRVAKLEKQQNTLIRGLRWAGDEIKPMFNVGGIGIYLVEVADKADKAGE